MSNSYEIVEIEDISHFSIHNELKAQLQGVLWRLNDNAYKELIVALKNNEAYGIGISWTNRFHPTAKYIRMYSLEYFPALLERLLLNVEPQNKFVFSCSEDEKNYIEWFEQAGFTLFRKTYEETFQIEELLSELKDIPSDDSHLLSVQAILETPKLQEQFFRLLKHNYEQAHLHNETGNFTWNEWKTQLLSDKPSLEINSVSVINDEIQGYILVHPSDAEHYEIGWVGQRYDFNLQVILKSQLLYLKHQGIKSIDIEVDTTDATAMKLFDFVDFNTIKSWNSYLLLSKNRFK